MIPCPDCCALGWVKGKTDASGWPLACSTCGGLTELTPTKAARVFRTTTRAITALCKHSNYWPGLRVLPAALREVSPETCARVLDRIPAEAIR